MSFYKEVPGRQTTLESTLKFDTTPTAGSTNPVTSGAVKEVEEKADAAAEALQEQIDDIAEKAGSGYTPKGEADVATLNGLSGQENGWLYTMTDAGTLTDGSLAVTAGDTVAWDATNSVWYKAMDYAPAQYGTNEVHNLATTATESDLVAGNFLAIDIPGIGGVTKKVPGNLVAPKSVQDNLCASLAPKFDPTRTSENAYKATEDVTYNGRVYRFTAPHYGAWTGADAVAITTGVVANSSVNRKSIADDDYKKRLLEDSEQVPVNFLDLDDPDVVLGYMYSLNSGWKQAGNFDDFVPGFGRRFGESGFIAVIPGETIYLYTSSGVGIQNIIYFDENKNFIGGANPSSVLTSLVVPNGVYYIRVPINGTNYLEGVNANYSVTRYPIVGEYVYRKFVRSSNKSQFLDKKDFIEFIGGENLINPNDPEVETGGFRNGRDNSWNVNANFYETGFIKVKKGVPFHYYRERTGSLPDVFPNIQFCLYDKDKNFISGGELGTDHKYFVIDPASNVEYIRIPCGVGNLDALGYYKFKKYVPYGVPDFIVATDVEKNLGQTGNPISQKAVTDAINNIDPSGAGLQWAGKKWYAYGTSITDTTPTGKYFGYLEQMSGMIGTDKGIGGGGIGNLGAYSHGQVLAAICNTTDGKTDADLITLETGPNDVNADVPLGTIYDDTTDTLAGCLNVALRYLQTNTNAQICVISSVATTTKPQEQNQYYKWYMMIRDICFINKVKFIAAPTNMGYAKLVSSSGSNYIVDAIHQTDLGGYVYAEAIWAELKNVPIFRTSLPS